MIRRMINYRMKPTIKTLIFSLILFLIALTLPAKADMIPMKPPFEFGYMMQNSGAAGMAIKDGWIGPNGSFPTVNTYIGFGLITIAIEGGVYLAQHPEKLQEWWNAWRAACERGNAANRYVTPDGRIVIY